MRHMRELSQPETARPPRARGLGGARVDSDLYARCRRDRRDVLAEYQPPKLPDDVAARIRAIVEEIDRAVGVA